MNSENTFDTLIIGGGPAGAAASIYSARKRLRGAIVTPEFGGQSNVSETIYNWIGTPEISGADLAKNLEKHIRAYEGEYLSIFEGYRANKIERKGDLFETTLSDGVNEKKVTSRSILIASGSQRRKLEVPGANRLEHRGLTYCASCDGPLFADQDVVVIGGGNAAFETAAQLLAYCKSVTMLHRSSNFRADEITVEKVLANPKMKALTNIEVLEVKGEKFVEAIVYKDKHEGTPITLPTTGIFVEIGQLPNTDYVKDLLPLDEIGRIPIDPTNGRAQLPGVWAAGDCTNVLYHQNNIAAGDAVRAIEDLYLYLHKR